MRNIIYSPDYEVDIGMHVFPTSKYRHIRDKLLEIEQITDECFIDPRAATIEELLRVHTAKYVNDIINGTISKADEIRLELPYSKELARASVLCSGGTLMACEGALKNFVGVHLGGGFHHAYPDHGEGFCVFNDIAVAAKDLISKGKKVLVVDCDLHQGNGTAFIFKDEPDVFTFSMHQKNNYPLYKEKSDMDIDLEDLIRGNIYNELLLEKLNIIADNFNPDFIIYVAGADTYVDDQLGGLSLTINDLLERDRIVKSVSDAVSIPVAIVLAGGYAKQIQDTVAIHLNTIATFLKI
ncbi:histone deacetylase [Elusimicrobiota bacterium]